MWILNTSWKKTSNNIQQAILIRSCPVWKEKVASYLIYNRSCITVLLCKMVGPEHIVTSQSIPLSARCKRMLGWRCLQNPQGHSRKIFPSWKEQEEERILPRRHVGHSRQLHQIWLGLIEQFPMWSTSLPPTFRQIRPLSMGCPEWWIAVRERPRAEMQPHNSLPVVSHECVCVWKLMWYIYIYKADTLLCGSCLFVEF